MPNGLYGVSLSIGGTTITKTITRSGDHPNPYEVSLPAAETGQLTTRTSDSVGTITMDSGHSIQTGDVIDIFWSTNVRYGVTVGTVSGDSVPITGGSGVVLPTNLTELTVDVQVVINTVIDGDNVQLAGIVMEIADGASTARGHIDMQDSGSSSIYEQDLVANVPKVWDIAGGDSNDLTGNVIETSHATNGDSSNAATIKVISLEDSTP